MALRLPLRSSLRNMHDGLCVDNVIVFSSLRSKSLLCESITPWTMAGKKNPADRQLRLELYYRAQQAIGRRNRKPEIHNDGQQTGSTLALLAVSINDRHFEFSTRLRISTSAIAPRYGHRKYCESPVHIFSVF